MISPAPFDGGMSRGAEADGRVRANLNAKLNGPGGGSSLGIPYAGNSDPPMAVDSGLAGY